jgi:hypothetical protein
MRRGRPSLIPSYTRTVSAVNYKMEKKRIFGEIVRRFLPRALPYDGKEISTIS